MFCVPFLSEFLQQYILLHAESPVLPLYIEISTIDYAEIQKINGLEFVYRKTIQSASAWNLIYCRFLSRKRSV